MENTNQKIHLSSENVEPLNIQEVSKVTGFSVATIRNWHYGRGPAPKGFPPPIENGGKLNWRNCDLYFYYKNAAYQKSNINCTKDSIFENINNTLLIPKPIRKRGRPRKISGGVTK